MDIAIIDSGIDMNLVVNKECIQNIFYIHHDQIQEKPWVSNEHHCHLPHGTLVYGTIEKYRQDCPIHYHIFNIIDSAYQGSSDSIIKALEMIEGIPSIKLILLSLTFRSEKNIHKISSFIRRFSQKGTLCVAAKSNRGEVSYPADLPEVIGVGRAGFVSSNDYIYEAYHSLGGDVLPEFIPFGTNQYQLFSGTSKAAAKIAATLANWIEFNRIEPLNSNHLEKLFKTHALPRTKDILPDVENEMECHQTNATWHANPKNQTVYQRMLVILEKDFPSSHIPYSLSKDMQNAFTLRLFENTLVQSLTHVLSEFKIDKKLSELNYCQFKTLCDLADFLAAEEEVVIQDERVNTAN